SARGLWILAAAARVGQILYAPVCRRAALEQPAVWTDPELGTAECVPSVERIETAAVAIDGADDELAPVGEPVNAQLAQSDDRRLLNGLQLCRLPHEGTPFQQTIGAC